MPEPPQIARAPAVTFRRTSVAQGRCSTLSQCIVPCESWVRFSESMTHWTGQRFLRSAAFQSKQRLICRRFMNSSLAPARQRARRSVSTLTPAPNTLGRAAPALHPQPDESQIFLPAITTVAPRIAAGSPSAVADCSRMAQPSSCGRCRTLAGSVRLVALPSHMPTVSTLVTLCR
ncbi:hypothetical protein Rleg5DRAFT_4286 [Rhizobium leguminosarum bv. viciae WSM1455]|nr:hypothetical protein Rleg5DRAFT_4286 [Rhizobium leguminosarum bv. viciae WSM1455]